MGIVSVNLKKRTDYSYPIFIGHDLGNFICSDLKKRRVGNKYVLISDSTAGKLHGPSFLSALRRSGLTANLLTFREGEKSKNLKTYSKVMEKVSAFGLDRKSAIIALGGGVVGDLAGFVAATYMRGISYVQVPTTLLAMVDSSVGGKVGVDLRHLKNAVGSFYHPKVVYSNISFLESLQPRQVSCGLAEVIKYSVISDARLFSSLERNIRKLLEKDRKSLIRVVRNSCRIKKKIVEKDEKEQNLRVVLNYGHTIGHAIESLTNYRRYSHGEAVSIGMNVAAHVSNRMGFMPERDVERQKQLLIKAGLPIKFPNIKTEAILNELHKDKKSFGNSIIFTLPEAIGSMKRVNGSYRIEVSKSAVRKAIEECR